MHDLLAAAAANAANSGSSAWVAGGAAILGAIVGGAATGFATYQIEKTRQRFSISVEERAQAYDREQELRAAQAVARLLYSEFARVWGMIGPSLETKAKWWEQEHHLVRNDLSQDDQKLLVQCLTAKEFVAVMHAHIGVDAVRALRDLLEGKEEPFADAAIELLKGSSDDIQGGMNALRRFARSDGVPEADPVTSASNPGNG